MTGAELRDLRTAHHLTQRQTARVLGVDKNTVARWERGEVSVSESAARLARILIGGEHPKRILKELDDS